MGRTRIGLAVAAAVALIAALAAPAAAIQLDDKAIFIEINATDGDAGIQLFLDGEGWDTMQVTSPSGEVLLNVVAEGSIAAQGVTELFFESAEPSFEEQSLEELLELFPEGSYRFAGVTTEGVSLTGRARLSHAIPDAPVIVSPEEEEEVAVDDLVVEWERVPSPPGSRIISYEVVVEKDEGRLQVFKADMSRDATSVSVPEEFLKPGTAYKVEVIAKERTGNQTITEVEFETTNGNGDDDD
jgi:hypothetical protein